MDYFGIFLVCFSGALAIATPLTTEPMMFMPNEREDYVIKFRRANILFGPSASTFAILMLSWNLFLPMFGIVEHTAIAIIGSVYLYILIVYSLVDPPSTPAISLFLTLNLIVTMVFYNPAIGNEHYTMIGLSLLSMFIGFSWELHWDLQPWKQNLQWYVWYACTFGGSVR